MAVWSCFGFAYYITCRCDISGDVSRRLSSQSERILVNAEGTVISMSFFKAVDDFVDVKSFNRVMIMSGVILIAVSEVVLSGTN